MRHLTLIGFLGMLLMTFVTADAFSALLDDNVVLYLPFDEGKGKVAKDQSKLKNDGEIRNAKWVNGKYGGGLEFNGTDAEVRVPDNKSLDLTELTLEVWYNPGKDGVGPGWKVIINKAFNEWYMYLQDSQPMFFINADGNNAKSPEKIPANKWTHLAGTYDGKEIKMYANGELKATFKYNAPINDRDCALEIGSRNPEGCAGNNVYWSPAGVRMDEIRISNVARTEKEIKASMKVGLAVDPSGKMATTWGQIRTRYFR
jgi:hypothetical protein